MTDYFLRESILPLMPRLMEVDLSACYMIGDASVKSLVKDYDRGRDTLQILRLNKCFGLSSKSLHWIGRYCKKLRVLDLGDGSGACQDRGLLQLLLNESEELEQLDEEEQQIDMDHDDEMDTETEMEEPRTTHHQSATPLRRMPRSLFTTDPARFPADTPSSPLPLGRNLTRVAFTLEKLHLHGADFVSESALTTFLSLLTSAPPTESRLQLIDLSNTFCVSPRVLESIYPEALYAADREMYVTNQRPGYAVHRESYVSGVDQGKRSHPQKTTPRRTLLLRLKNCDQLMVNDVQTLVRRIQQYSSVDRRFEAIRHVRGEETCKLRDDSFESVRRYLLALTQ